MFLCDPIAVAVAIQPDIIEDSQAYFVEIETAGKVTKGQSVVHKNSWGMLPPYSPNTTIVKKVNKEKFFQMLVDSVS